MAPTYRGFGEGCMGEQVAVGVMCRFPRGRMDRMNTTFSCVLCGRMETFKGCGDPEGFGGEDQRHRACRGLRAKAITGSWHSLANSRSEVGACMHASWPGTPHRNYGQKPAQLKGDAASTYMNFLTVWEMNVVQKSTSRQNISSMVYCSRPAVTSVMLCAMACSSPLLFTASPSARPPIASMTTVQGNTAQGMCNKAA
eukprot:65255-Chlamydomonas_euryale.AAC.1